MTSWPAWATEKVEVREPDAAWQQRGERECQLLASTLSPWLVAPVEHVGSTAVPGLAAKPILDLQAAVEDLEGTPNIAVAFRRVLALRPGGSRRPAVASVLRQGHRRPPGRPPSRDEEGPRPLGPAAGVPQRSSLGLCSRRALRETKEGPGCSIRRRPGGVHRCQAGVRPDRDQQQEGRLRGRRVARKRIVLRRSPGCACGHR